MLKLQMLKLMVCVLALLAASFARADDLNDRLLAEARSSADRYAALEARQLARAAAAQDAQARALMAPWRLELLRRAALSTSQSPPAPAAELTNGLFQPASWAFGSRNEAPAAARAAASGAPAVPSAAGDVSRGQAPTLPTYSNGRFVAPSGGYTLPTLPTTAR